MHIITLLSPFLLQTALVYAAPGADLGISVRGNSCPGDQTWCGWTKSCKCDNGYVWDSKNQKCHYPAWQKLNCPSNQNCYCGKSESEYCKYDAENEYCYNNGHNKVFCSTTDYLPTMLKKNCPSDHPTCPDTQMWDSDSGSCKCPNGKVWRDNKCKHPLMPKPSCSGKQQPCCAKDQNNWCSWDTSRKECSDNGKHITFCAMPGKEQQYCDQYWN